ncbi:MAG: ketoacyl-ACP synthase III [Chromatiales bacterium]|nr:ketoacyl-ACP synthase III [Chromatiales bacterium]
MTVYAKITGSGSYLPKKILSNKDLEKMVDTSDQWIRERTGVQQRHIAADAESSSALGYYAALKAMQMAGVANKDIDLLICATTTPDKVFPSNACIMQRRLGIHQCPAFDVQAVCTGFVYALDIANRFIKTGGAKCALVVGTEILSHIIDWSDRSTCVLFGDGAGAVVLQADTKPGIYSTHIHADGQYEELLYVDGMPASGNCYIRMKGSEVFKTAVKTLGQIVDETLAANNLERGAIDWLVPHQANLRILSAIAKKLALPMERVVVTVDKHANTSAASIPLALDEAIRDQRIQSEDTIMLAAFGGGFTWGSALLKF